MPARLNKEQLRLIVAIAIGCAVGNVVGRGFNDTTSTWLAVLIGSAVAVVVALGVVGLMSVFVKP